MANGIFNGKSYTQLTRLNVTDDLRVRGLPGLSWGGAWRPIGYSEGAMVNDAGWLRVANKFTYDRAAPLPNGSATFVLPTVPAFATNSNTSVIYSGHTYTFLESGWAKSIRVWVPTLSGTTNYRFILIVTTPEGIVTTNIFEEPVLNAGAWTTLALGNTIVIAGTTLRFVVDALDSGSSTDFQHEWTYQGAGNELVPNTGSVVRNNPNTILRYDKTDANSVDRTAELASIIANSSIIIEATDDFNRSQSYRVNTSTDEGTYFEYGVEFLGNGSAGALINGENSLTKFSVPIASSTDYAELAAFFPAGNPTWATVEGYLAFDDFNNTQPGVATSAFGVDLEFQPASVSEDWDFAAFTDF